MIKFDINTSKNLLAFSAGIDSSALFFLLLKQNIPFDIAIVDYNVRLQSKEEVAYAESLALKYNKKCFLKEVKVENTSNFEKIARDIRYTFFDEIIKENSYESLITAHQLNDKLEWFLMQLTKGAGLVELIGLEEKTYKNNYTILRPLLNHSKEELENFLQEHGIKYFVDQTNFNKKYKRNHFRKEYANTLIKEYKNGIKNSFEYLKKDLDSLAISYTPIYQNKKLDIFKNHLDDNINIKIIDKSLKKRGILLSTSQRNEILEQKEITISHKINISITANYIYVAPKINTTMDKKFKEYCRINKIPKNIRAYIFQEKIDFIF